MSQDNLSQNDDTRDKPKVPLSISENFHQYFKIRIANTKALRREAFNIRHQVYCEELGWEEERKDKMEIDEFDRFSYTCLLEHRATKKIAGCVRFVIPPPNDQTQVTPFEAHCLSSLNDKVLSLKDYPRGSFGEISRLAVPASFRRRPNEKNMPYILTAGNDGEKTHTFSEEERRNFPNIAVGLYLASIALAKLCNHQANFVMMEPKLHRRIVRFGLPFIQVGHVIDYHGPRALFYLRAADFTAHLNSELFALYEDILGQVTQQISLFPYTDPTDF